MSYTEDIKHFFSSDYHINHENIITYCKRPFKDRNHMNEEIIKRHNSRVRPQDHFHFIGDFALGEKAAIPEYLGRLNGIKHMYYGNHDDPRYHPISTSFQKETDQAKGWTSWQEEGYLNIDGKVVWVAHIPLQKEGATDKRGYYRTKAKLPYDIVLCGHVHDKWVLNEVGCINVGVDNFNFYPQTLAEILEKAKHETPFVWTSASEIH